MRAARIFQIVLFLGFFGAVMTGAGVSAAAQSSSSEASRREMLEQMRRDQGFDNLRRITSASQPKTVRKDADADKPKPTAKDLQALVVAAEDKARYAAFLKQPHTGIFRLHDFSNCERSSKVYNVEEPCPAHLADKGSAYSFDEEDYKIGWLADISLDDAAFRIRKIRTLSFLTDLGDTAIESLTLAAGGVREMAEFVPSSDKKEVIDQAKIASRGFQIGKYVYKTSRPLRENSTYALRLITYRLENANPAVKAKPLDVIVVFRVVRAYPDGSATILWKELQRQDAPRLPDKKFFAQYQSSPPKR